MRLVDSILMELEQEAKATLRVLERVPANKLSWKPHPKSMSLGQLALHVASTPGNVANIAAVDSFELPPFSQAEATSSKEILEAHTQSVAEAKRLLGPMDDGKMMALWSATRDGKAFMTVPRIGVLRAIMLNHWYHHRGQLCVYLRLLDVPVPSVYGPSADEAPAM